MTTKYNPESRQVGINEVAVEAEAAGVGVLPRYKLICSLIEDEGLYLSIAKRRELVRILAEKGEPMADKIGGLEQLLAAAEDVLDNEWNEVISPYRPEFISISSELLERLADAVNEIKGARQQATFTAPAFEKWAAEWADQQGYKEPR